MIKIEENKIMNPVKDFNPDTFLVEGRERKDPPRTLPTFGLKPKKILEGQMIGMYESKQDLYLMIALLSERVTALEDKLKKND